jgi:hypothetical protein
MHSIKRLAMLSPSEEMSKAAEIEEKRRSCEAVKSGYQPDTTIILNSFDAQSRPFLYTSQTDQHQL